MAKLRDSRTCDDEASKLSSLLVTWLTQVKIEDLFRTCMSCKNLGKDGVGCKLYPGHPVPAHIVVNGCDKHEDVDKRFGTTTKFDDDIPF